MITQERAPSVGFADRSPASGGAGNPPRRFFFSSLAYGGAGPKGLRGLLTLGAFGVLCVWPTLATATSPLLPQPPRPVIQKEQPIVDDFSGLPKASSFAVCIANKSYRGCCSSHLGVKDIRDNNLICMDESPSRTCAGVTVSLKGCCKDHGGIYGVDTNGVVICNDQTSSPSCKLGLCKNEPS